MNSKLQDEVVSPQLLRTYEQDSEQAERQEFRGIEAAVERLTQADPEIEISIEKLAMDVNNGKRRLAGAEKRVQDFKYNAFHSP